MAILNQKDQAHIQHDGNNLIKPVHTKKTAHCKKSAVFCDAESQIC